MSRRASPVSPQDVVDLTIERLADGGRGVARHDGFVLFVQRGMPGDIVRARVTRVRRSYAEAVVEEIVTPGPSAVAPPCRFYGTCGGCAWQAFDYPAQLEAKQQQVLEAITRLGGYENPPLHPIVPATHQLGYRNKIEYSFGYDAPDASDVAVAAPTPDLAATPVTPDLAATPVVEIEPDKGPLGAGFHALGRWDQIVPVDPCLIADPRGLPVHRTVVDWARRHDIPAWDQTTGDGILRNLVVRVGYNTGEVMAHLVTSTDKLPRLAELVDDLQAEVPGLVSILHSVNTGTAQVASGDTPPLLLWGRDYYEEELAGVRLRVRASSFLQTNTEMAERLYEIVRDVAQLRPDDTAYDLYCGIGSIALMLAKHVEKVVGVEVVQEAIDCANENAELNGVDNVEFQVGNVRPVLKFAAGVWPDPTVVVVDPPRSGLVDKVIRRICARRPERIIYVSCNPATFAANLPTLRDHGYELKFVQPVDQFPHTHHVELVARLEPIPGWEPSDEIKAAADRVPGQRAERAQAAADDVDA